MLIDKLTERRQTNKLLKGETNTFADLVKFFFLGGLYVKLIISSYKCCFLATVYCGCISFCPQYVFHQENRTGWNMERQECGELCLIDKGSPFAP